MQETRLSQVDLHRMLASGANLAVESAKVQTEELRGVINQQGAEIAFLKAQLAMSESGRQTEARRKAAASAFEAAKKSHDALGEELGDTYGVDWKKSVFCPTTGEISSLPDNLDDARKLAQG